MLAAVLLARIARDERKLQLLLRAIAAGVPSERDLLLEYGIGELYQELSLFIEETEMQKRELEKLTKKK